MVLMKKNGFCCKMQNYYLTASHSINFVHFSSELEGISESQNRILNQIWYESLKPY